MDTVYRWGLLGSRALRIWNQHGKGFIKERRKAWVKRRRGMEDGLASEE
jgi:hypothetical protein